MLEYGNAGFASRDGKRSWGADKRPGQEVPIAEWRQEDPGTMPAGDVYGGGSPTGVAFYENGALGDKWRGLLLACEAGRNVVFGYLPKPDGAGFKLERFDFLTSNKEKKFAGSDFLGGSQQREQVRDSKRSSVRPMCASGRTARSTSRTGSTRASAATPISTTRRRGTIYRIAPKGFKSMVPKIDLATTEGQIAALKSPAVNVRNSGFTRLKAQGEKAVPAVAALLKDRESFHRRARRVAARADGAGGRGGGEAVARREGRHDAAGGVSRAAPGGHGGAGDGDENGGRRIGGDPPRSGADLARCAGRAQPRSAGEDRPRVSMAGTATYLEALGTGCEGKEREVYAALLESMGGPAEEWSEAFAWIAWRLHVPEAVVDLKKRALSPLLPNPQRKLAMDALAFIPTAEAATAMVELAVTKDFPFPEDPKWWLRNRMGNDWEPFAVGETMAARGLGNPEKAKLTTITMPEPPTGVAPLPTLPELLQLPGDAARGQTAAAVCLTCHRIGGQGVDFGPNLTTFGQQQPREVLFKSIVAPSADISHGYDGSRVETTDGIVIDGIVQSKRNPMIVKSMGGVTQQIWRRRLKSETKLEKSLMFTAETMGLTAESIADIVAYLQSDLIK